ncbi:MAG TPA: ABC transporter substrate-binding protein [Stellaceae bacterium]|jgi:peptide/nickel transport system substrate-binding protein|nr:ABC transporter substrate-binding protein [Stellaceae bacterium]
MLGTISRSLAAGLLLGGVAAAGANAESVIRIGLQEDPDSFDPARAYSFVGRIVLTSLCNKLIDAAPDLHFVPQLALSWETSADGKTVTFRLRPGVKFSDGTELDAAAVALNLDRAMHLPESRRKSEVAALDTVDVIDPLTVRLNLKNPFAPLIAQLSDRAGLVASPKALKNPAGFDQAPACSGPFKMAERAVQDHIALVRDPNYWDAGRIHIDRVEFRIIPDPAVRLANLRAGALDFAERILASDVAGLKADPRFKVLVGPSLQYNGITINIANGTGGNPDFAKTPQLREALDLAIDRDAINQVLFAGNAVPDNQPQPVSSPYHSPDRPMQPRDLARAQSLVKASGVTHPTLELMVINSADQAQLGQMLQSMAAEAGIEIKLKTLEFQTLLSQQAKGDYQASLIGWSGRVDPDGNIYTLLGCKSPTNDCRYCEPTAEALLLGGQAETNLEARQKLYHQAIDKIVDDRPIIYLYHPPLIQAMTAKLTGFGFHTDGLIRLQDVQYSP